MSRLNFKLEAVASGSRARACSFTTLHGPVQTPIFMPVGTQATVKSQTVTSLKTTGSNILLANTYHLLLRPGPEVLKKFGGIHRFMNWDGPVLTDSGGFQIFSLPHSRQMDEHGAIFLSYVDRKPIVLSPEVSIQTQRAIGSDIMMVLDQCIPSTAPHEQARLAMELTHRWARRSLIAREDSPQSVFAIVQGACYRDLREQSAAELTQMHVGNESFDGFAIGGLAVGETKSEREDFTEIAAAMLPLDRPRYLMGVGTPIDILEAVHRGVDMFDCILPSQLAQRGVAFTSQGKFQMRRTVYKFADEALDPDCDCETCRNYSKAYLHHLYKAEEPLGWHLLALHNFTFYHRLMREMRAAILNDTFAEYYRQKRVELVRSDEQNPSTPVATPKRKRADKNRRLGDYEVHVSAHGFSSIKQVSSGEIMHSVNPPEVEAHSLYLEPSQLERRTNSGQETVIWDVGLGAGTNALAVIQEATRLAATESPLSKIELISFEIDLDPIRLALKNPGAFPFLRHAAPHALLEQGHWQSSEPPIEWRLLEGDFLHTMDEAPPPDLIYYDPFSIHVDSALWHGSTFARVRERCGSRATQLMTYSASTSVRAALLANGFFVGYGKQTGPKESTTIAFTDMESAKNHGKLLGREWLERWERSQAKYPADLSVDAGARAAFEQSIRNHPQFRL